MCEKTESCDRICEGRRVPVNSLIVDSGTGLIALNGKQLDGILQLDLHIGADGCYADVRLDLT